MINNIEHLTSKVLQYSDNRDWYKNSNTLIKKHYPKDYSMFIDVLSITSPRTSVKYNIIYAIKTVDIIKYKRTNNIIYGLANKQIRNNLTKYINHQQFNGVKINNFAGSLKLKQGSCCIDSWMLKAFDINRKSPTNKDIREINKIIRTISDNLGFKTYETQACLWCYAKKELNGTTNKAYHDFSYYLKQYFEQTNLKMWVE